MLFFLDESGQDQRVVPYEVLAAVAIKEESLWNVIKNIHSAEEAIFGLRLKQIGKEIKGSRLLKKKTFRHANQESPIEKGERMRLCREFLLKGARARKSGIPKNYSRQEFSAFGQAAVAFVDELFDICARFKIKIFASMVPRGASRPEGKNYLRKDYAYLFERIYYFLEDIDPVEQGLIIFDEIEKAQARLLINQMEEYFVKTRKGRKRSDRIIPQPFFVHSDLTTAIQLADVMAYCLNWGFRLGYMDGRIREEILPFSKMAASIRYSGKRYDELLDKEFPVYGIVHIKDLRSREDQEADE